MASKSHLVLIAAAVVVGLAANCTPASAQERPCAEYVKTFCPGNKPGTPKAMTCLKQHLADVSAACKTRVLAATAAGNAKSRGLPAKLQACKSDLEKFCKDVQPGAGRLLSCLKGHEQDLAPGCKEKMAP